jgi:threonine/homoserine/homoserine lactone efflux protein
VSGSSYLEFAAVSVAVIAIPGPSVLFAISRAVMGGRRQGLLTVLGNAGGLFAQVALVAVGVGVIVSGSAEADAALRTLGAGYLIWLGAGAIRHRGRSDGDSHDDTTAGARAGARERPSVTLRHGFVVGVSNPKSIVLLAALFPQYVDPAAGMALAQMVLLGAVFCAMAIVCDSAWVMAAAWARSWLGGSPSRLRTADVAAGLVMIALAGWLLLSG